MPRSFPQLPVSPVQCDLQVGHLPTEQGLARVHDAEPPSGARQEDGVHVVANFLPRVQLPAAAALNDLSPFVQDVTIRLRDLRRPHEARRDRRVDDVGGHQLGVDGALGREEEPASLAVATDVPSI